MLNIHLKSFSYRKGVPTPQSEEDGNLHGGGFVFDCRCVYNPGREDKFKPQTGLDKDVANFLENRNDAEEFFNLTKQLVLNAIISYQQRGFEHLSVYYGCTGGRHRSVYFSQRLANELSKSKDVKVDIHHNEVKEK